MSDSCNCKREVPANFTGEACSVALGFAAGLQGFSNNNYHN